jgi:inorganic pyrophosphatase
MRTNKQYQAVSPFDDSGLVNVIIDTPRNSSNKYVHNSETGLFKMSGVLTAGHAFPYDFGFVPNTVGGDDDAVDVLVLMDAPAFVGCWVECRVIGGLKAMQTAEDGKKNRNDRFLAVEKHSLVYGSVESIEDLDQTLLDQIEHFFVSYNEAKGRKFEVIEKMDSKAAEKIIRESIKDDSK